MGSSMPKIEYTEGRVRLPPPQDRVKVTKYVNKALYHLSFLFLNYRLDFI